LRIFNVEELETHGGSLRIYACHEESIHKKDSSVDELLKVEELKGMNKIEYYQNFQAKVDKIKMNFLEYLIDAKRMGLKVAGYGAAAKGNTFINFSGVRYDLLSFVVDASPYKQGKFLPGSRIPVYSVDKLVEFNPDIVIIFPWNIKKEIIGQLNLKLKKSKFVTFIPEFETTE
jgi:hypothetical protein